MSAEKVMLLKKINVIAIANAPAAEKMSPFTLRIVMGAMTVLGVVTCLSVIAKLGGL